MKFQTFVTGNYGRGLLGFDGRQFLRSEWFVIAVDDSYFFLSFGELTKALVKKNLISRT